MTTIPQRLRDIAKHIHECGITKDARRLKGIAAELEAPDAVSAEVVAEYLYGHPRSKAVEWAKEDKFDSCYRQAEEICDLLKISALQQQLGAVAKAAGDAEAQAVTTVNRLHAENSALQARITELERQKEIDVEQGNVSVAHYASVLRQLSDAQARINALEARQLPEGSIPITRQSLAELIQDGYMAGAKRGVETAVTDLLARGWTAPQSSHPDTSKEQP